MITDISKKGFKMGEYICTSEIKLFLVAGGWWLVVGG
jgi:hypothetical protein